MTIITGTGASAGECSVVWCSILGEPMSGGGALAVSRSLESDLTRSMIGGGTSELYSKTIE